MSDTYIVRMAVVASIEAHSAIQAELCAELLLETAEFMNVPSGWNFNIMESDAYGSEMKADG